MITKTKSQKGKGGSTTSSSPKTTQNDSTMPTTGDRKIDSWIENASKAQKSTTPANVGFPSDDFLRKVISKHTGQKCPPKKIPIPRSLLSDIAVSLNLITREDADLAHPPKKKTSTSWFDIVNNCKPLESPIAQASEDDYLDEEELTKLLEDHTGHLAPGNQSRSKLIEMALYLNLVSIRHSNAPRPEYLYIEDLERLWEARDKTNEVLFCFLSFNVTFDFNSTLYLFRLRKSSNPKDGLR
jgi:hypothetical protein